MDVLRNVSEFFWPTFDPNKCKIYVQSAVIRMNLRKKKGIEMRKMAEKEVAELIKQEKDELARLKIEQLIRDQGFLDAFEILELFCELVSTRMGVLEMFKEIPNDMKEAVYSLVWASLRVPIPELKQLAAQFRLKYGEEFCKDAMANHYEIVNEQLVRYLTVMVPDRSVVDEEIVRLSPVPSKAKLRDFKESEQEVPEDLRERGNQAFPPISLPTYPAHAPEANILPGGPPQPTIYFPSPPPIQTPQAPPDLFPSHPPQPFITNHHLPPPPHLGATNASTAVSPQPPPPLSHPQPQGHPPFLPNNVSNHQHVDHQLPPQFTQTDSITPYSPSWNAPQNNPQFTFTSNDADLNSLPSVPQEQDMKGEDEPVSRDEDSDFEALSARFEALKRGI